MWPFSKKDPVEKVAVQQRRFAAAQISDLLNKWTKTTEQIDADLQQGGRVLRARARQMAKDNVYAKKYLDILKTNVVGKDGIRLQCRAKSRNGELDKQANDLVEEAWTRFSQPGECDVTGKLSLIDAQTLFIASCARDGEVLIREYHGYKNAAGYALQFLDPDLLDEDHNSDLKNGRYIRMGIEYNRNGYPIAYHLTPIKFDRVRGKSYRQANRRQRVLSGEIIHAYRPDYSNQSRGFTWMHAAMVELHHLGAFREAAIVASRIGASTMGFFTEGLEGGSYSGDGSSATGELTNEVEPGQFRKLPAGVDIKAFDGKYPSDMVDAFEKRSLKGISSGLNVSYNVLASDPESTSYGTLRAFTLDDRDHFRSLQQFVSSVLLQRVYRGFLSNGLATGYIGLPSERYKKLLNVRWQPRGWQWIDPSKDATSFEKMITNKLVSRSQIAAEQGRDFEEVCQEMQRDNKLLEKYGLTEKEAPDA